MSRKYVICAPGPRVSAGVRVLYALRDELRARGHDAYVFNWEHARMGTPTDMKRCEITDADREESLVVYPETIRGNPLGFRNVVRWVLNMPGLLGGDAVYHAGELVFSWCSAYLPSAPLLTFDAIDHSLFYAEEGIGRDVVCTFEHKGGKVREMLEIADAVRITMDWPASREELAALLRRTRVLYSHDDNSTILEEALACGAEVRIVTSDGSRPFSSRHLYDPTAFKAQMQSFIDLTQGLRWTGEVNRDGYYPGVGRGMLRMRQIGAWLMEVSTRRTVFGRMRRILGQARDFA